MALDTPFSRFVRSTGADKDAEMLAVLERASERQSMTIATLGRVFDLLDQLNAAGFAMPPGHDEGDPLL